MTEERANIDYALITKYLAGETSPEENEAVSVWLNASKGNGQVFAQLESAWQQSGRIIPHEHADVDVDKGWQQFKNRIRSENSFLPKEKTETKTRNLFYYFSRVAALLVIGLTIYFLYQNRQGSAAIKELIVASSHQVVTDTLPDGSVISLNTHSSLSFPEEFSLHKRPVALQGEAFFDVTANPEKPFVVKAGDLEVTVLGTSFRIQAYDSLDFITIGVEEGKVKVASHQSSIILKTGESISIDRASGELPSVTPYNYNELYWKSNTLIFQRQKLSEVFRTLEQTHDIRITTENDRILDCRLTAKFYGESIQQILEIISTNFNLTSTNEGNRFIIAGNGCQ